MASRIQSSKIDHFQPISEVCNFRAIRLKREASYKAKQDSTLDHCGKLKLQSYHFEDIILEDRPLSTINPLSFSLTISRMAGYQIVNQYGLHFLTFTIVGWIDVIAASCLCDHESSYPYDSIDC